MVTAVRQRTSSRRAGRLGLRGALGDTLTDAGMPRLAARVFARCSPDKERADDRAAELAESSSRWPGRASTVPYST